MLQQIKTILHIVSGGPQPYHGAASPYAWDYGTMLQPTSHKPRRYKCRG
jgi:hypothetical protein